MSKKNKKKSYINFEPFDRHCPICGVFVRAGSNFHHCSQKILDMIDKERQKQEKEEEQIDDRDRFQEASPFIETDDFFYNDDDDTEDSQKNKRII